MLFPGPGFSQLGTVKMLFPPAMCDLYDDFQDFCFFAAHLLRVPDMLHYVRTMEFCAVKEARVPLKDDRHLDGLNILQRLPAVKEAKIPLKDDRHSGRLGSLQDASKDECDLALQRTSTFCTTNFKKVPKVHLQFLDTPNTPKQKGAKHKRHSRCKNEPKTSTPSQQCHIVQNCIIYSEECHALKNKVQQLEQEVTVLKRQLSDVLVSQQGTCMVNNNHCSVSTIQSIPPPPPPPPPPPLHSVQNFNIPRDPMRKTKISKERGKENHRFDMKEVLKGINDKKLRHIEKSPGGTPVRPNYADRKQSQNSLEVALRKRLAAFHPLDSGDEDDINSP